MLPVFSQYVQSMNTCCCASSKDFLSLWKNTPAKATGWVWAGQGSQIYFFFPSGKHFHSPFFFFFLTGSCKGCPGKDEDDREWGNSGIKPIPLCCLWVKCMYLYFVSVVQLESLKRKRTGWKNSEVETWLQYCYLSHSHSHTDATERTFSVTMLCPRQLDEPNLSFLCLSVWPVQHLGCNYQGRRILKEAFRGMMGEKNVLNYLHLLKETLQKFAIIFEWCGRKSM